MKSTIHMANFFEPAGECPTCKSSDVSNADGVFAHWECSSCGVLWPKEPVRGPAPASPFVWTQSTRNHHVGRLNVSRPWPCTLPAVCAVVRGQKHRPDGTPQDWIVEIFNSRALFARDRRPFDARNLESAKAAAEQGARRQIEDLYRALYAEPKPQKGSGA